MKQDSTLARLQAQYLTPQHSNTEPVKFENFDGVQTIKAAITGDLPPIDLTTSDGKPEGFNIALLSEIARRLKINVTIFDINSGSRFAALTSGRADVVFWFENCHGVKTQPDVPEGIILSEPYYKFDTFYHLELANNNENEK